MKLIEITDKKRLDEFVASNGGDFLQSWSWGEFQRAVGYEVIRLGVADQADNLLAVVTLIKKVLPGARYYWFAPRGPIITYHVSHITYQTLVDFLVEELKISAKKEKVAFLRFEPPVTLDQAQHYYWKEFIETDQVVATIALEPKQTAVLDLTKGSGDLLKAMHQKTRYNIRLAEKKGVEIIRGTESDFPDWWRLLQNTGSRDGFRLHDKNYYQQMMKVDLGQLYLAKHDTKILAGVFIIRFGNTMTYAHGASSNEGRNLMAPYLLQWQAIKDALTDDFERYDFFGVDKDKWPGVSRFKDGFSGQNLAYLGTFDLVFNKGYYRIYQVLRKLRRMI